MNTDIYKLLEEVYDYGYNEGDGFKQKMMLSDFLYQKQQAITALIQEARVDELKRLVAIRDKHKYTTYPGQYLNDRIKQLSGGSNNESNN